MSSRIGHAPASTGRTPNPPFTGKSNKPVVPAELATKAEKASGQNSAVKKGTELFLDEFRDWALTLLLSGEESFKLFRNDAVQHAFFRMTRDVFNTGCPHAPASRQELSQLKQ